MKTSNILLISLLAIMLLFVVGSNLVLKAEFDKIDRKDEFYGYKQESVKPFKYVKLQGKQIGVTQIQPGNSFEIRYNADRKLFDYKIAGDTIEILFKRTWEDEFDRYDDFNSKPALYVTAPKLSGINAEKSTIIVKDWKDQSLMIKQKGNAVLLTNNKINSLSVLLNAGAYMKIDGKNQIGNSSAQVKDSSSLEANKNIFKSFQANVDSTGFIKLPGDLYRK